MMIGKNIKRLRVNAGITQEQLAERLHISGQAVSKGEKKPLSQTLRCCRIWQIVLGSP